jgi:hypothetical protein
LSEIDSGKPGGLSMGVSSFVHAGVVVDDLAVVVEFLTSLGLECGEPMTVEGEWLDRIVDLPDARVEIVMARAPDGTGTLELAKFHAPPAHADAEPAPPNRPGIRHIAYTVDTCARSSTGCARPAGTRSATSSITGATTCCVMSADRRGSSLSSPSRFVPSRPRQVIEQS